VLFHPRSSDDTKAALVFLPGGGVAPHAYVPFVRAVADAGHPAALVYLPWRLAPSEDDRAEVWRRVLGARQSWGADRPVVLAGHSRGAALAARFAGDHPARLNGLLLIATTHPKDRNLTAFPAPVVKIVAEHDYVASPIAARANAHLLPATTRWVEIAGGNHAQFGHYGSQLNDCGATITRAAQQAQALSTALGLLGEAGPISR
jgi:pimeloyl-ACP methyl ester carboxylesterase